eukprot:scaffold50622_cov57-Phaeocystis_antarctica.AAC.2
MPLPPARRSRHVLCVICDRCHAASNPSAVSNPLSPSTALATALTSFAMRRPPSSTATATASTATASVGAPPPARSGSLCKRASSSSCSAATEPVPPGSPAARSSQPRTASSRDRGTASSPAAACRLTIAGCCSRALRRPGASHVCGSATSSNRPPVSDAARLSARPGCHSASSGTHTWRSMLTAAAPPIAAAQLPQCNTTASSSPLKASHDDTASSTSTPPGGTTTTSDALSS